MPGARCAAALLIALATGTSCARPFAPPGGERDAAAPRLVSTTPAPLAVVAAGDFPVVIRFDERISERGFSEALFSVSPLDSALRVDRSGSEIEVRIDGGWRPNRVYRVVLLPGLVDLFGNARQDPVELVFSTGAPVGNTALAGIVLDRLTGGPAQQGVVDAVHETEGARYTALADSSGFYSLRYLPTGEYDVRAYDDQNSNRRRDALEPVDSGHPAVFAQPTDTVALIFHVLAPDTSAPRIVETLAVDSVHVAVQFDDHFDPGVFETIGAEVHALPDSARYAGSVGVISAAAFNAQQQAAADSAAMVRDTAGAGIDTAAVPVDTTAIPVDTAAVSVDTAPAPVDTAAALVDTAAAMDPGALLPTREVVIVLDRALVPGTYTITVSGVVNLHGLSGGGTARFEMESREPPPPPLPPDTTRSGGGT